MEKYIGTKIIKAEPMRLGDYNKFRGWTIPKDEDPNREGYKVQYPDGYISWSPKEIFEEAYKKIDGMNFGLAVESVKKGFKIARKGWNGKGMFVYYVPASEYKTMTDVAKRAFGDKAKYNAYLAIKTVSGSVSTWAPSVNDALAEDWIIVE